VSASAEAAPSGGFACAVAALAEQQHMLGDSSSTAICQTSRHDILSRSQRSFTDDLSVAGSSSSGTRVEEPSTSRTRQQTREGTEYSNNDGWSEAAEAGTSFAGSDVTVEAGAANLAASDVSSIGTVPDSFEEQMMLAMALSLADARAVGSSPGTTWR
jgi:hypothetical protein